MPKYVFECPDCNVRFERNLQMEAHTSHECPSCHDPAPRVLDGEGPGVFSFATKEGQPLANTGVHDLDYPTADKAVGRSATARWGVYDEREKVKNEARKLGQTHALMRRTTKDYIDYEPMSDAGRTARRDLAKAALTAVKKGRVGSGQG